MHTRHRAPSVFNISMVDVLCCALGCVILLWLLNLRDAKEKAATVGSTSELLVKSKRAADDLAKRLAEAEQQLKTTLAARDSALRQVAAASLDLKAARSKEEDLKTQVTSTENRLALLMEEQRELSKQKTDALARLAISESTVRDKNKSVAQAQAEVLALAEALQAAEARIKQMQGMVNMVPGLRKELDTYRTKLDEADARLRSTESDYGKQKRDWVDSGRRIEMLQKEKQALSDEMGRVRAAADNRFAGIALTGKRVVFLIDMSGSMELVESGKPAPDKWTGVRETLTKIIRSLPELQKFQLILFSDRVLFPLAPEGTWVDFEPKTSVLQVIAAMAGIRPRGETNMYAGLDAAFRYRAMGMETLYLLSDGLPSAGEGLPTGGARPLTDREIAESLSQHIRRVLKSRWNVPTATQPRVRINTIGFFYESPDVGAFLWALARENDGSFVGMSTP